MISAFPATPLPRFRRWESFGKTEAAGAPRYAAFLQAQAQRSRVVLLHEKGGAQGALRRVGLDAQRGGGSQGQRQGTFSSPHVSPCEFLRVLTNLEGCFRRLGSRSVPGLPCNQSEFLFAQDMNHVWGLASDPGKASWMRQPFEFYGGKRYRAVGLDPWKIKIDGTKSSSITIWDAVVDGWSSLFQPRSLHK